MMGKIQHIVQVHDGRLIEMFFESRDALEEYLEDNDLWAKLVRVKPDCESWRVMGSSKEVASCES